MIKMLLAAILAVSMFATPALADSIYGTAEYKDGSKVDGTATISTSWNNKKAFPKNGKYELDFGGKVRKSITIYVNGNFYKKIYVKGRTCLNIVVP